MNERFDCFLYFAAFFAVAFFGAAAALGFAAFFGVAAFFAAVGALLFFGVVVVVFFALDVVDFFVDTFFGPAAFAPTAFAFGLTCVGFFVAFVALADFGVALERDLVPVVTFAFLAFAADESALVVAELLTFAAVAIFFVGLLPADFDRDRFFVGVAVVDGDFFGLLDVFFVSVVSVFAANLNEPLAPFPLVCFKTFDLTPFFKANFKC